jgi:hypothetical protein
LPAPFLVPALEEPEESNFVTQTQNAFKELGDGCKKFFGGPRALEDYAKIAEKLKFFQTVGPQASMPIPDYSPRTTVSQYWNNTPRGSIAVTVSSGSGTSLRVHPVVILGPGFFSFAYAGAWNVLYGGDMAKFQRDILVHEFMHYFLQKDDMGLAQFWELAGKGYQFNDTITASQAVQMFLLNDCQRMPRRRL